MSLVGGILIASIISFSIAHAFGGGKPAPPPPPPLTIPIPISVVALPSPLMVPLNNTATWTDPATWITDGSTVSAKKIRDNFDQLRTKLIQRNSTTGRYGVGNAVELVNSVGWQSMGNGSTVESTICPVDYVMTGMEVHANFFGAIVGRYGIEGIRPVCTLVQNMGLASSPMGTWDVPSTWVKNSSVISVQKVVDSFNYLYDLTSGSVINRNRVTTSAQVGGGGTLYTLSCPVGSVVVGIKTGSGFSGGIVWRYIISSLSPICAPVKTSVAAITPSSTASWSVPSTWVTQGSIVSAQKMADNFNYISSRANSTATSSISFGTTTVSAGVGWGGGGRYGQSKSSFVCPAGSAVTGVVTRGGISQRYTAFRLIRLYRFYALSALEPLCSPVGPGILYTSLPAVILHQVR